MFKMLDDIIFFSSLLLCMSLGSYYKKIEDPEMKRNYGSGLGILIACLICGHHIYHSVLMVWGNVIIIKCCDKSYVHQMSLAFTWIYLFYLHLNIKNMYIIWLYQTLALRLVGVAFEIRAVEKIKIEAKGASTSKPVLADIDSNEVDPQAVDIITYAYYFIGLHKGPYYRWKIFNDHLKTPFGALDEYRVITEQKLKKALICALGYNLLRMKYSPDMYYNNDFYSKYGTDFRFLYNLPQLIMYFLYVQCIAMICTSVYTETGFGVYPAKCQPVPGHGPTTRLSLLKLAADSPDLAFEQEFNFLMFKCFENDKIIFGPKMKDTMNSWEMPTRYWFTTYIYKNILPSNKEVRSALSFFLYTIWRGPSLSQVIISSTLWVYVHLEAEYCELYKPHGSLKMTWEIGYSIMRLFCLLYLTPCILFKDTSLILQYYNSMFWIFHIVLFFLIILSIIIYKTRSES